MGSEENGEREAEREEQREADADEREENREEGTERDDSEGRDGEREDGDQEDRQEEGDEEERPELGDQPLKAPEARELIARWRLQVLDVRSHDEFGEVRIAGALHSPEDELDENLDELSKDEPVVVVCGDGERSAAVAEKLREQGFEATSVEGGMSGWSSASLPVQPREAEEFHGPTRPGPLGS
jgi:rhodanese-related sulfurtransferase